MDRGELKQALISGDPAAWQAVYNRYVRIVSGILRDDELAHDTLSEVFKSIERFNPGYKMTQWVIGIARNVRRCDYRKKLRRDMSYQDMPRQSEAAIDNLLCDKKTKTPLSVTVQKDVMEKLDEAIAKLSPMHRNTFVLYYKQQLPTRAIAEKLGISEKDVLNRIDYARRLLRKALSSHYTEKFMRILAKPDKRLTLGGTIERYVVKEYRDCCRLFFIKGRPIKEIARSLSLKPENVLFRLGRGLLQMKPQLGEKKFEELKKQLPA